MRRILAQAARELLLLQSSDWQFLISTVHARDYAELRFDSHYQAFMKLAALAKRLRAGGTPTDEDIRSLDAIEVRDRLFADINLDWFRKVEYMA
jgi:1,4-alpha-glucan branching enzyme